MNNYLNAYNKEYYERFDSDRGYDSSEMQTFLKHVALMTLNFFPKTVIDVGCAYGIIVSELRRFGVDAYGVDASQYAVSMAKEQDKDFIKQSALPELKLPDSFPQKFDLLLCIEVLEHIPEEMAYKSIKRLTELSDLILFSSSPYDTVEPTHLNVQPQQYWIDLFQKLNFELTDIGVSFVSQQAMMFKKSQ